MAGSRTAASSPDKAAANTNQDQGDTARSLSPERRADLHASGVTDKAIDKLSPYDDPQDRGWILPWSDGVDSIEVGVYDRDKRPADGRKAVWPKGKTTIVNYLHEDGNDAALVVEGIPQQLAALSYAEPLMLDVYGMNGCDGIHQGIADRLGWAAGKLISLALDADHQTNPRVRGAVERVAKLLRGAGATSVRLVDLSGHKRADNDGLDDVLARTPEHERVELLADLLDDAREIVHPRTQTILNAVLDATELDSLPEPVRMVAIPGQVAYLNERESVWMSGKFGTYKSFLALAWSFSVATGRPWSAAEVKEPLPIIYIAAEGVTGLRKRLRALERRHGLVVPKGMLTVIRRPVHLERCEEIDALRLVIEQKQARLIVLDTWHRMAGRAEENNGTKQAEPIDEALALRDDYGATVLILDHTGHAQRHARGTTAKEDDIDASWLIDRSYAVR